MTYPNDRRTLLNKKARLLAERDRMQAEYARAAETAKLLAIQIATSNEEWKRIAAEWSNREKSPDGGTIAENAGRLTDRERLAAERLRVYANLAAAMIESLSLYFRMCGLDIALNDQVAEIYEIGRRLDDLDNPTG